MIHTISGNNFHGNFEVRLRGPAGGFVLSLAQARKYSAAVCGVSDCTCGGSTQYGDGLDDGSASVEQSNYDELTLIPADAD